MASTIVGLCENCVTGYRLAGDPKGEMRTLAGQQAYFRTASTSKTKEKTIVVLFSDGYGLPLMNTQIIADRMSETLGIDCCVPDMFEGNPPLKGDPLGPYHSDQPGHKKTWGQTFGLVFLLLRLLPGIYANRPSVITGRIEPMLRELRADGYTNIGVAGYCMGGRTAAYFATRADLCTTSVILQPSPVPDSEVNDIAVPTSWIFPEEDDFFPPAKRDHVEALLRVKSGRPAAEFMTYKGTTHGFAVRPNMNIPEVKQAFEDALARTIEWFQRTLITSAPIVPSG